MRNNMKTTKMRKISIALFAIMGMYGANANAQWAVKDVQMEMFFMPVTGLFTQAMGQQSNAVKGAIDTLRLTMEISQKQQEVLSQQNDIRARQARGEAEIAKRDLNLQPTVATCIELTNRWSKVAAGGGGLKPASTGTSVDKDKRLELMTTPDKAMKEVLVNKAVLGTCSAKDAAAGLEGCKAPGDLAGADIKAVGLVANTSKSQLTPTAKADGINADGTVKEGVIVNYSLDTPAYKAALNNINNKVYYSKDFLSITPEQMKDEKNGGPEYAATYDLVNSKLGTAYEALLNITNLSRASDLPTNSLAAQNWAKNKGDWDAVFLNRLAFPEKNPSLRDMVNFTVYKDYLGVSEKNEQLNDEKEIMKSINERMALNNFIAWKQYELAADNNKLLAQILTQSVSPVTTNDLKTLRGSASLAKQ